jgi:hypothetical protein
MQIALLLLVLVQPPKSSPPRFFIPTSDLVDIGRRVSRDAGYLVDDRNVYFLDVLTTEESRSLRPNIDSIGLYAHGDLILEISVYTPTGQIVDTTRCLSFEYANLRPFQERVTRQTGARPLSREELASTIGCPSLRPLRRASDRP